MTASLMIRANARWADPIMACTFLVAAAAGRYCLQTTESRLQAVGFAIVAVGVELVRSRSLRQRFSVSRSAFNAFSAATGITLMKWHLEGFHVPPALLARF
jgi:hypothetical protein